MLDYLIGFLSGAIAMFLMNRFLIYQELKNIRNEFLVIHHRLISVIAEWQKKV